MMSSLGTSSPVSASTLAYLMRWPVLRLIWLKLIFSESDVAGYKATGQVTSERRRKPFQLARGAIQILQRDRTRIQDERGRLVPTRRSELFSTRTFPSGLSFRSVFVLLGHGRGNRSGNHPVMEPASPS